MVSQLLRAGLVGLLPLIGSGCMTVLNMRDGPDPKCEFVNKLPPQSIYGGVRLNAMETSEGVVGFFTDPGMTIGDRAWAPFYLTLFLADLPLEVVADTLTLPLTIPATLKRSADPDGPTDSGDDADLRRRKVGGSSGGRPWR
jgi:hypothetical protein